MIKKGGTSPPARSITDFNNFVLDNAIFYVLPDNGAFTWTNHRVGFSQIAIRLDRFICPQICKLDHTSMLVEVIPFLDSDHFPIQFSLDLTSNPGSFSSRSSFKFESVWFMHPSFHSLLNQWWMAALVVDGSMMFKFYKKMAFIKNLNKAWNVNAFKNIFEKKSKVEKELVEINQQIFTNGLDPQTFLIQKHLLESWVELCAREEEYWGQKSQELWL